MTKKTSMSRKDGYFEYLKGLITWSDEYSFDILFKKLYETEFIYVHSRDYSRAADGISLREDYLNDVGLDDFGKDIVKTPVGESCSVFEMIIALAKRMEFITDDGTLETSIKNWFWLLMDNLDLTNMDDDNFDEDKFYSIMHIFMSRKYRRDGTEGGLFPIKGCRKNLRNEEIWYQMNWYLDSIYD